MSVAEVADIYVIGPEISFPAAPTPHVVRTTGCHYVIARAHHLGDTPEWRDLAASLAGADTRFVPRAGRGELRLGIVLNDRRGTLWETYASDTAQANGRMNGLDRRRWVEIPSSFVTALLGFVARHRDRALPDSESTRSCPRARPR